MIRDVHAQWALELFFSFVHFSVVLSHAMSSPQWIFRRCQSAVKPIYIYCRCSRIHLAASLRSKRSWMIRTKNSGRAKEFFALGPRGKWGKSKKVEGARWGKRKKGALFFPPVPSPSRSFHFFALASFSPLPFIRLLRCWDQAFFFCSKGFPPLVPKKNAWSRDFPDSNTDQPREEAQYMLFLWISETPTFAPGSFNCDIVRLLPGIMDLAWYCLDSAQRAEVTGFYQISYLNHSRALIQMWLCRYKATSLPVSRFLRSAPKNLFDNILISLFLEIVLSITDLENWTAKRFQMKIK